MAELKKCLAFKSEDLSSEPKIHMEKKLRCGESGLYPSVMAKQR